MYMYKYDLALNNLHGLISYKPRQTKSYIYSIYMYEGGLGVDNLQGLICLKVQPNQILYM